MILFSICSIGPIQQKIGSIPMSKLLRVGELSGVVVRFPFDQFDSRGMIPVKRLEVLDLFELAEVFSNARPKLYAEKGTGFDVYATLFGLENVFKKFIVEQAAFPLTRESASEAVKAIDSVLLEYFFKDSTREKFKDGLDISSEMNTWFLYGVRAKLEQFRHVLAVECRKSETYFIERVAGFDLPMLLHSADENIHHIIRPFVPKAALEEIREAGRCLALENYTASGFHTLRGLEVVISAYYKAVSNKDKEFRSWHDYVEALEELAVGTDGTRPKYPSSKAAAMIDRMRELDRNPLMHPSDTLDEMSADSLFKLGIITITELAKDLRDMASQRELKLIAKDGEVV
ncbi:hypothetical protein [Bradyrhizobium cenepequi]